MRKGLLIFLLLPCASPLYAQVDTLPAMPAQQLNEIEVLSGYKKYKADSIRTATIYRKHIQDAQFKLKPQLAKEAIRAGEIGVIMPGAVSELARRISGQKKKDKRLLKAIESDMKDKYIAIRYHDSVIKNVTGMVDDSIMPFMKAYPMPVDFARTATPLELKMWIRYNYKQWLNKPKDSLQMIPLPKQ